ncbi:MAG: DUF2007 domain-containing protein [Cystobacterineae bacterium]|nr:DUF2007 domain-containing protein [Cystobacterineae bacterium]
MLVTIATFSFLHEARLAQTQLDALDIPSFIADEYTLSNLQWPYENIIGGVRLQVSEEFAAQAQEVLNEPVEIVPTPELELEPEPCPYCGGTLGEPYIAKPPPIIGWFFLEVSVRQCMACGKTTQA